MLYHSVATVPLLAAALAFLAPTVRSDEPKALVSELSLEVDALRTLHYLKATPEQMRDLKRLAKQTASLAKPRKGTASADYLQALTELRDALVDANDNDRIDELDDQLDQRREAEKPDLQADVQITPAARKHAPMLLRQLKAPQVASYIAAVVDEVADPLNRLNESLEKVRGLRPAEWREQKDEIAEQVAALVAGVEEGSASKVRDQVIALLSRAHALSPHEFKAKRADLERAAKQIVGDAGPTEVLRNLVETALAEMLSNPRLGAALDARLK